MNQKNFHESIKFYSTVFGFEPNVYCENRWVEFNGDSKLAIYNIDYDILNIKKNDVKDKYNENFVDEFNNSNNIERKNNIVVFNFHTNTLQEDYEKFKKLNIGDMSEIMYVNIVEPYYYFNIKDPDGNILEISSEYY